MRLQVPWVNGLADGFSVKDIEAARHFVTARRNRVEHTAARSKAPM
jgi:hypothetical protein